MSTAGSASSTPETAGRKGVMKRDRVRQHVPNSKVLERADQAVAIVKRHGIKVDCVVYPERGGRIPARRFAKTYGIPPQRVYPFEIRCYTDNGQPLDTPVLGSMPRREDIEGKVVVLIDDRFHNGRTILLVEDYLKELGPKEVVVVTLWFASDLGNLGQYRGLSPFSGEPVPDHVWLDFDWEPPRGTVDSVETELVRDGLIDPKPQ